MQVIPLWIGSIIGSKALEISDILYMYKVAADNGYKMDSSKIGPVTVLDETADSKIEYYVSFVPILNLFVQFERSIVTRTQIEEILRNFNEFGAMEEMSKEEKEEYQEKPTGRNAYIISEKAYKKYRLPLYAKVNDSVGILDLEIGKDLQEVIVTDKTGSFEALDDEFVKEFVTYLIQKFENKEEFIEAVEESNKIIIEELKLQLEIAKRIQKIALKEAKKYEKEVAKEIDKTYNELEKQKKTSKEETRLTVIDKEKQALVEYKKELKNTSKKEKQENLLKYINQLDEKKIRLEEIKENLLSDSSLKKSKDTTSNKEKKK